MSSFGNIIAADKRTIARSTTAHARQASMQVFLQRMKEES
jgi:hypothetical protein